MKPQLAKHVYKEAEKKKPGYVGQAYAVFEKYDGWYGYYDLGTDDIMSRTGRAIPSVKHLVPELKSRFYEGATGRLIFEILLEDVTEFHTLNGILNRRRELAKSAYLKFHDYVKDSTTPFKERYDTLKIVLNGMSDRYQLAPVLATVTSPSMFQRYAERIWERGGEGIILKDKNAPYMASKRNATLLKIKEEVTLDLLVTGILRGEDKYANTLGSLVVEQMNGKVHYVSGMTDALRSLWWSNPDLIKGKVVEINAMKTLPNGSLREPRFKAIRHDKTRFDID